MNTNPSPTFEWYRNGIRINSSTLIGDVIHSGYGKSYLTLTEDEIQEKTDNYSCKATNTAGTSIATVEVIAEGAVVR